MERVKIRAAGRDLDLEYCRLGEENHNRPVVVFLHEGLGSVAMWRDFPARLCRELRLRGLAYSRFGYGRSTPRPHGERFPVDYLHREALEVLPALLDTLGIARPWLFGHSDGGSIALLAAAGLPRRFPGIVVLAPHVFVEEESLAGIRLARTAYREQSLRERLAPYHDDVDSAFYGWNDVWLDPDFRDWNIEAEIEKIDCPVLAIQGVGDDYASLEQLHRIRRRTNDTRLLILPDCRHSPHRDRPEEVIRATAAFLIPSPPPAVSGW